MFYVPQPSMLNNTPHPIPHTPPPHHHYLPNSSTSRPHHSDSILSLIARFMGPTWGLSGAGRTQVAPCWPHELCYLGYHTISSYPGYFWEPHWNSMGLQEISRATLNFVGLLPLPLYWIYRRNIYKFCLTTSPYVFNVHGNHAKIFAIKPGYNINLRSWHKSYNLVRLLQLWPMMNICIDGLVQDCSNSSALAMELLQSCAEPSIHVLNV